MQPAFLLGSFFPPPAPLAFMLVGQHRAGAGLAADAHKTPFMQAVVGNLQHADVVPYIDAAVVCQRVELDELPVRRGEGAVDFDYRHMAAGTRALVPALAGHPGVHGGQLAPQRGDLANTAALAMAALIEVEQPLFLDVGLERALIRGQYLELDAVVL